MDIMTIFRIGGYALAGLGAGYWASILICRAARTVTVTSRRRMSVLGGVLGVCIALATVAIDVTKAPPLEKLRTATELDRVLATSSGTPIVLTFYAGWCPPSHTLAPTVRDLQRRWGGRVKFYRVNVDESIHLKERFAIRSIPTLIYFQGQQEMERTIGMVGPEHIELRLMRLIEAAESSSRTAVASAQTSPRR